MIKKYNDLRLSEDGNIAFENNDFALVELDSDTERTQRLDKTLSNHKGDWFLDSLNGLDWSLILFEELDEGSILILIDTFIKIAVNNVNDTRELNYKLEKGNLIITGIVVFDDKVEIPFTLNNELRSLE